VNDPLTRKASLPDTVLNVVLAAFAGISLFGGLFVPAAERLAWYVTVGAIYGFAVVFTYVAALISWKVLAKRHGIKRVGSRPTLLKAAALGFGPQSWYERNRSE
jgi:predicted lysophospholipase L1 biosynthesis ABC-type transport system permease subunit